MLDPSPTSGSRQAHRGWRQRLAVTRGALPPPPHAAGAEPAPNPEWPTEAVTAAQGDDIAEVPDERRTRTRLSVGDQLRELNRQRVEQELSEDEFNRRKAELFTNRGTP